jgi:hypothetical protein
MLTCGSGCGELYWDEWLSDPPDACDPCDNCGNWIGPQLPGPSCFHRFLAGSCSLWGYRWMGQGCDAFPGEPTVDLFGDEGIVIENESVVEGQPVEAIPPKAKADPGQGTKQPTPAQPVPDRHARRPTQLRSWGSLPASFRSYRMQ